MIQQFHLTMQGIHPAPDDADVITSTWHSRVIKCTATCLVLIRTRNGEPLNKLPRALFYVSCQCKRTCRAICPTTTMPAPMAPTAMNIITGTGAKTHNRHQSILTSPLLPPSRAYLGGEVVVPALSYLVCLRSRLTSRVGQTGR